MICSLVWCSAVLAPLFLADACFDATLSHRSLVPRSLIPAQHTRRPLYAFIYFIQQSTWVVLFKTKHKSLCILFITICHRLIGTFPLESPSKCRPFDNNQKQQQKLMASTTKPHNRILTRIVPPYRMPSCNVNSMFYEQFHNLLLCNYSCIV